MNPLFHELSSLELASLVDLFASFPLFTGILKIKNLNKVINTINANSKISLRLIDWFVTNYAKQKFTVYNIEKNNSVIRFKVYFDYKLKLKAYSKKRFDPFCRWERITIPYKNGSVIQTTIGQLNFFKWALENGVIEYLSLIHI